MKYLKFIPILLLTVFLNGCVFDDPKYINFKDKPNLYYYSNEVYENLKKDYKYSIRVFDYNFYKYYDVSENDSDIMLSFLQSLTNNNYIEEAPTDITEPLYKIIITFDNSKKSTFAVDVYNNNFVSLYPWDGSLEKDNITMDGVPRYDNLYDFCVHIVTNTNTSN